MDRHIKEYFSQSTENGPQGHFHKVIVLHDAPDAEFDLIGRSLPDECRGWLELAQLPTSDRIDLVKEYWFYKMKNSPRLINFLVSFFETVDDIGIFITQSHPNEPLESHMVYSLPNDTGFYRGKLPATEGQLLEIQDRFTEWVLPSDYLAFLQVHNGFAKATDCTGITCTDKLIPAYERFQAYLDQQDPLYTTTGRAVDAKSLIPFYESYGMPFYQCFWNEWHPEGEMGNVYYSGLTHTIIDPEGELGKAEQMAFATFADWLVFYLERIG